MLGSLKKYCPLGVKKAVKRLRRKGLILMYHRIHDSTQDPHRLNVAPWKFDEHMRVLKKYGKTVSISLMAEKSLFHPRYDEIAITFDDGSADNFHAARPILEKYEIPATFYIPSHALETRQTFWWDKLACLLDVKSLPKIFDISFNHQRWRWEVDSTLETEPPLTDDEILFNSVVSKKQLAFFLWRLVRPLPFYQQETVIDQVIHWAGKAPFEESYVPMSLEELNQMARSSLFEIGAHTVHHPLLSALSDYEQEQEIARGKQTLEQWINKEVTSFAYPFGDYTKKTPDILKRLSFKNACTVAAKPVYHRMNPYLLPRFMVFNWDGCQFEERLRGWSC